MNTTAAVPTHDIGSVVYYLNHEGVTDGSGWITSAQLNHASPKPLGHRGCG